MIKLDEKLLGAVLFMSIELLDRTRRINRLLHDNRVGKVAFNDICSVLGELLDSNVLVISKKGKILGVHIREGEILDGIPTKVGDYLDKKINERLLNILSTKENVNLDTIGLSGKCSETVCALITPITIAGDRLGSLFVYRKHDLFNIDDIILSEYGTTVVGLEMMRAVKEESEYEKRREKVFRDAITTLSPLEMKAMMCLFQKLNGLSGTLVTSKLAEEVGITRTVIVNALRKIESAGLIKTKSSGMKGTHIEVLDTIVCQGFAGTKEKNAYEMS